MTRPDRPSLAHFPALRVTAVALALAAAVASAAPRTARPPATGSHRYTLVLLTAGERPPLAPQVAESLQAGHLANIRAMFQAGTLDAAGPMGDESPLIGLFIFDSDAPDLDSLLAPDPILRAGRLRAQPHVWIAPDGLGEAYRKLGSFDPGGRDSMVSFSFVLLHRGPKWTANITPGLPKLLEAQSHELERWRQDGVLRMAGPIEGTGELRGVYVLAADSAAAAARLAHDPAVKAGRLVPEIHPWWTAYGVVPGS